MNLAFQPAPTRPSIVTTLRRSQDGASAIVKRAAWRAEQALHERASSIAVFGFAKVMGVWVNTVGDRWTAGVKSPKEASRPDDMSSQLPF